MRALLLALLAAASALRPLQVDQAAVSKCIDKARPLEAGLVVQRRAFRERLGDVDARAADMLYDALTRGRGPTLVANAELAAWRASPSAFASAVAGARAYVGAATRCGASPRCSTASASRRGPAALPRSSRRRPWR